MLARSRPSPFHGLEVADPMKSFFSYLACNKRYWVTPILLFVALLLYLAFKSSKTPVDPFEYRLY